MTDKLIIETIEISNPEKLLFKDISKKDLVLYYLKIFKRMFPYLERRIISTIRCPDGIDGTCFFKKHLEINNDGLGVILISNDKDNKNDYYYIKNVTGLISEVQMNAIEFHIWGCTKDNLNKPDLMVFDLDPDEKMNIEQVRQGVRDLKSILDSFSLTSFLKTSGGKGYHVLVPFKPKADYKKFREFAKNIAELMETKWPELYTSNVRMENRQNKIFIDWIRNTKGSSCVSPYSVRKKDNATVSMPILWSELDKISPNEIGIKEAIKRLKRKDPWEDFFKINQQIK